MQGIAPIQDGDFSFDPRLFPGVREAPDEAAALLGALTLPTEIEVPVWCYLVETEDGPNLVDTGGGPVMGPGFGAMARELSRLGVSRHDIRRVWLTHLHGDHCGGLLSPEGGAAFPEARIALASDEAAFWLDGDVLDALRPIAKDARWALAPYADRIDLVRSGDLVGDGRAISAPGHTAGHMAWAFERHGAIAAGDIVHVPGLQLARPAWSTDWDHDPDEAAATRSALMAKAVTEELTLLTGHAGALPHQRLQSEAARA